MTPYEIIKAKRDGRRLRPEDIRGFIADYTAGRVPDYQMSALLMAVFWRGLDPEELGAWTQAMLESGEVLDLSETPGIKVDKHSTGGVGDKVSICLAPIVAACGVPVPMISGRGLGHTGGTLDKLESIPGFRVNLSVDDYRRLVREVGACLIGQTDTLAPADKKLYALRDVTATVDCLPLIASSIMSKKLAEGVDALVLDVKFGSGAFMKRIEDARALGDTMIQIGRAMGREVVGLLTDMNQPLGRKVGNALEVEEAIAVLRGEAPSDLTELTYALAAEMLVLGGKATDAVGAKAVVSDAVGSGRALRKLHEIVGAQGGDARVVEDPRRLPRARAVTPLRAKRSGYLSTIDTEAVGLAAVALGAGRLSKEQAVDPAVGFVLHKRLGEQVQANEPLLDIHYNDDKVVEDVKRRLSEAYEIADAPPRVGPLILERLGASTVQ